MNNSLNGNKEQRRTRFNRTQINALKQKFDQNRYPKERELSLIANELGLNLKCVTIWFQNARQKFKHKKPDSNDHNKVDVQEIFCKNSNDDDESLNDYEDQNNKSSSSIDSSANKSNYDPNHNCSAQNSNIVSSKWKFIVFKQFWIKRIQNRIIILNGSFNL
jgi:hypothetical protein